MKFIEIDYINQKWHYKLRYMHIMYYFLVGNDVEQQLLHQEYLLIENPNLEGNPQ